MQSLNVITNILSQDTDLQTKDNLEQSYNHDEKASFSHLVNQRIAEEKRTSANKEQPNRGNTHPEVNRQTLAASEYDEQHDLNQQDTDRYISKSEISKQVDHLNVEENTSENSKLSALDIATADSDTSQEKEVEIQHSPEQFMNLLYSSDKTLTLSTVDSKLLITQADTNTNKDLSDFDVASVNPLKIKSLATESAKSELKDHVSKTMTKQGEASTHNLVEEKNSSSSLDTAVKKIPEDSADKKLSQPGPQESLVVTNQLKSKAILKHNEVKQQPTSKVQSELSSETVGTSADKQLNKNNEIMRGVLADQILPEKLSKNQSSQGFSESNNQPEVYQGDKQTSHQIESDIIDDAVGLRLENMAGNSKGEAINADQKKINPTNSQFKTSQPENLTKDLALKNKIITENNFYDVNALESNDKYIGKEFSVANHTVIRSENLSQKIIKNSAEQSQNIVTDEENLKENLEEPTLSEIDNLLLNVEKPKLARPVNVFSDNATSRLAQELQFQAGQTTQNKQSNEAYLAHQVSEALNHNIASDTAHIQKNNVQLQQETIAIFRKDFADVVKDKVLVMINQKLQKFEITLDPPEFGNMQVRVNLQGEQASVNFIVQNQQAKEALEQNMQKLKDMLSEQGVDVGGANVEQQNQREQNEQRNNFASGELINDKLMSEGETQQVFSANIYDISETAIDYYA
jgi:flagellar hook-length control protein FliK